MSDNQLTTLLEEFEAAAQALRDSLLERNTDRIWTALARQELAAEQLGALRNAHAESLSGASGRNPVIRHLLERCQTMLRTNRAMAGRFLDVIDQTLSQMAGGASGAYSCSGSAVRRSTPLLVRQQG